MKSNQDNFQVDIVDFQGSKIAVFEHRGNPNLIGNSVRKFIEWGKENKIPSNQRVIYNLVYDDPATTEPEKYRFDICIAVNSDVKENNFGVINKVIPRGRCAILRHMEPMKILLKLSAIYIKNGYLQVVKNCEIFLYFSEG